MASETCIYFDNSIPAYSITFSGSNLHDLTRTIESSLTQLKIATAAIDTMSSYSSRSHRSSRSGDTRSEYSQGESRYSQSSRSRSSYSQRSSPSYVPSAYRPTNAPEYSRRLKDTKSVSGYSHRQGSARSSSRSSRSDHIARSENRQSARRHRPTSYASSETYIGSGGYPESNVSYTSRDIARRSDYAGSESGRPMDGRSSYASSHSSRSSATRSRCPTDDRSFTDGGSSYSSSRTSESTATFSPLEQKNDRRRHGEQEYDHEAGYNTEIRRPPGDVRRG